MQDVEWHRNIMVRVVLNWGNQGTDAPGAPNYLKTVLATHWGLPSQLDMAKPYSYVAFVCIQIDGPHVVVPDIVVLKTKDNEPGNEHHIEIVNQVSREEVQQIKEQPEP